MLSLWFTSLAKSFLSAQPLGGVSKKWCQAVLKQSLMIIRSNCGSHPLYLQSDEYWRRPARDSNDIHGSNMGRWAVGLLVLLRVMGITCVYAGIGLIWGTLTSWPAWPHHLYPYVYHEASVVHTDCMPSQWGPSPVSQPLFIVWSLYLIPPPPPLPMTTVVWHSAANFFFVKS
jgi:hypothetical protein